MGEHQIKQQGGDVPFIHLRPLLIGRVLIPSLRGTQPSDSVNLMPQLKLCQYPKEGALDGTRTRDLPHRQRAALSTELPGQQHDTAKPPMRQIDPLPLRNGPHATAKFIGKGQGASLEHDNRE